MSATLTVVYWRDIPAQVIARAGRNTAKRELPGRFAEAIDRAAMRAGLTGTDAYLDEWRRGAPTPCGDELGAEAERAVQALDAQYPPEFLKALASGGGKPSALASRSANRTSRA